MKQSQKNSYQIQTKVAKTCKSNLKRFWKYIQSKCWSFTGIGDLKVQSSNHSYSVVTDDSEKVEIFSEYFSKVFTVESSDYLHHCPWECQNSVSVFSIQE